MSATIVNQNATVRHEIGALYVVEGPSYTGHILLGAYGSIISLTSPGLTWIPGESNEVSLNAHLGALKVRRLPKGTIIEFTSEK